MKMSRSMLFMAWATVLGVTAPLYACATDYGKPALKTVKVPADTDLIIFLKQDGSLSTLQQDGIELKECQPCSGKLSDRYGSHCEKAPDNLSPPICWSLVRATLDSLQRIDVMTNRKNPWCKVVSGGQVQWKWYSTPTCPR